MCLTSHHLCDKSHTHIIKKNKRSLNAFRRTGKSVEQRSRRQTQRFVPAFQQTDFAFGDVDSQRNDAARVCQKIARHETDPQIAFDQRRNLVRRGGFDGGIERRPVSREQIGVKTMRRRLFVQANQRITRQIGERQRRVRQMRERPSDNGGFTKSFD